MPALKLNSKRRRRVREAVFEEWSGRCAYCDRPATTLDHVDARFNGGSSSSRWNLLPACKICNGNKGSQTIEEFLRHIPERLAWINRRFRILKEGHDRTVDLMQSDGWRGYGNRPTEPGPD